ncbi:MAG: agmatine deiminase family protein [Bacteroidales bacterium]|nr:agmatine deiminase family protein [Bacteroidales bacterium]MBD5376630.1 agmatine deiminase family protein [Bacteroides sp.]
MGIESTLSIIASVLAIGGAILGGYKLIKQKPLTALMTELADKNTSVKRQHRILSIIDKRLMLSSRHISATYINGFHSNGRSKQAIFYDICNENNIEPTIEICKLLLGYDEKKFRKDWIACHLGNNSNATTSINPEAQIPKPIANDENATETVYLSAILAKQYGETCKRLTDILNKHNIPFVFLEGTNDIWCRDYMPVQTPSGKLIQFRYNPSYLKSPEYSHSQSDVRHVDKVNNINPIFSDINLDGGNVVMYGNKAIITDRIFTENPDWDKEKLINELSTLLECEIVIIPAYKHDYDFTGHADGMMRFVDNNTVLVNNLDQDFKYMKEAIVKALDKANLKHINFPWFEHKIKGNNDHAIGIYLNYLEVGNLIVMPVFAVPGNKDAEALDKLKEVFPNKIIETIDYNDVALAGGILNCTTWIKRK